MNSKILLSGNTAWSMSNFRYELIEKLILNGNEVVVVSTPDDHVERLEAVGCRFVPLHIDGKSKNFLKEMVLLWRIFTIFFKEKPDLVINYTIKPVIYGSLVTQALRIPTISVITGMGSTFLNRNMFTLLVEFLYRISQRAVSTAFVLNKDDFDIFQSRRLISEFVLEILPGEGVNLEYFSTPIGAELARQHRPFRFILIARMLWEKGVGEYVEAAKILKKTHPDVEFCLLGFLDVDNDSAISKEQMTIWTNEANVRYLGVSKDVRPFIDGADCVVLPSYYMEGLPRCLLEAAAMSKPIVTTNSVGCRDVVEDGVTGFLCTPRDEVDLADKMDEIIGLSSDQRREMGRRGREKVEREFDQKIVIDLYLNHINKIVEP
ncbi:glycosyltransferase family 4 protein [Pseudomonadales bacterium]|nr:glycosyltransferase family 4 protein [Pseudomonadales bacterium]